MKNFIKLFLIIFLLNASLTYGSGFFGGGGGGSANWASPGTIGSTTPNTGTFTTLSTTGQTSVEIGTNVAPSIAFTGDTGTGIYQNSLGYVDIALSGVRRYAFVAAAFEPIVASDLGQGSFPWRNGTFTAELLASDVSPVTYSLSSALDVAGNVFASSTAPTISSGFGTGASVTANNGTVAFRINVGTGGTASTGVIAMPNVVLTGWNCFVTDLTTKSASVSSTKQTESTTTTVTIGNYTDVSAIGPWAASDVLAISCFGF